MAAESRLQGRCYCGGVRFSVAAAARPVFTAYCHCDSCRRAHAAPLYQVVCVDRGEHRIEQGAELVQDFQRPGVDIVRAFCTACGTRLHNTFGRWRPRGQDPLVLFPALLEPEDQARMPAAWAPRHHNEPESCVLDWDVLARIQPG